MPLPKSYTTRADGTIWYANDVNTIQTDLTELSKIPATWNRRTVMQALANPNATTINTVGTTAPTVTQTTLTNADDLDGPFHDVATSTSNGNSAGWSVTGRVVYADWLPELVARVKTPATVTTLRYWIGFFSASPTGSATPTAHLAAFRYDTTADGTAFWRCCTDDNGAAPTVVITNVALAANTAYDLRVRFASTTVIEFYINDVKVGESLSNLPALVTNLGWYAHVTTLTTAARSLKISRVGITHK